MTNELTSFSPSRIIKGNLITLGQTDRFDVIVHGCNCLNIMEAGIAKQIKFHFPVAYLIDKATTKGDRSKLGDYSHAIIRANGYNVIVVNAYTQYNYGPGVQIDYDAIRSVFRKIKEDFRGLKIGYPKIGAGLGGGNWDEIQSIIAQELEGEHHTLVILS